MARVRRTLQIAKPVDEVSCPFWRLSLSAADAEALPFSPRSVSPTPSEDEQDDEPQIEIEEDPSTRVAAEHVFAIGDVADAFGAVNAGHNAFFQGEVAARNILKLVRRREGAATAEDMKLEKYSPGPPAIKVSLGLVSVLARGVVVVGMLTFACAEQERVPVPGRERDEGARVARPRRASHLALLRVCRLARGPRDRHRSSRPCGSLVVIGLWTASATVRGLCLDRTGCADEAGTCDAGLQNRERRIIGGKRLAGSLIDRFVGRVRANSSPGLFLEARTLRQDPKCSAVSG